MKTGMQKTGLQSVWALALSLGVLLAAQAQPADSTGAGRAISAQGTISSSTATTGTYTPPPAQVIDTPPAPVYDANRAWALSFVGETKCLPNDPNYCFKINPDGTILRIGSGESCWGQSTDWPIGSAPVGLVGYEFGRSYEATRGGWTNQLYSSFGATARPTQNAQGR